MSIRRLFEKWPKLDTLSLPGLRIKSSATPAQLPPSVVRTLTISLVIGTRFNTYAFTLLRPAIHASLRHLDLGTFVDPWSLNSEPDDLGMQALLSLMPQLYSLKVCVVTRDAYTYWSGQSVTTGFSQTHYLTQLVQALRDARVLRLGICGYEMSRLFVMVEPLAHLHTLSAAYAHCELTDVPFGQITSAATTDFIVNAPALVHLTLPAQSKDLWTATGLDSVESAAERSGVTVEFE